MAVFTNEQVIQNVPLPVDGSGFTQPVSGPLTDTELRATPVPVSGPLTDTQLRATPVPVVQGASTLATVTNVSVGVSSVTLSASNAAKTKVIVHNETGTLFVKLGSAASSASYSYRLTANTVAEISGYSGIITAIKASGTTPVLVTEIGI